MKVIFRLDNGQKVSADAADLKLHQMKEGDNAVYLCIPVGPDKLRPLVKFDVNLQPVKPVEAPVTKKKTRKK